MFYRYVGLGPCSEDVSIRTFGYVPCSEAASIQTYCPVIHLSSRVVFVEGDSLWHGAQETRISYNKYTTTNCNLPDAGRRLEKVFED
jgi:hypothetical protein